MTVIFSIGDQVRFIGHQDHANGRAIGGGRDDERTGVRVGSVGTVVATGSREPEGASYLCSADYFIAVTVGEQEIVTCPHSLARA